MQIDMWFSEIATLQEKIMKTVHPIKILRVYDPLSPQTFVYFRNGLILILFDSSFRKIKIFRITETLTIYSHKKLSIKNK